MRILRTFLFIQMFAVIFIACSDPGSGSKNAVDSAGAAAPDTSKKSIPSTVSKKINDAQLTINYYAPAVRGRVIWGGLVAYDNVWVTGAHRATNLEVSKDFVVGETNVPAGKYAIFTIPSKEVWTVIINRNWDQHLADEYSEADDVVRIQVKPVVLNETVERLRYEIDQTGEGRAAISMSWDKLQVPFLIRIVD